MNHKEIIERLKEGNKRFVEGKLTHPNQYAGRREELFDSQNPMAVVLTCSDSRIVPEVMFDTGLGDLFVFIFYTNTTIFCKFLYPHTVYS